MTKAKKLIPVRPTFSIRELSTSRSRFVDGISSAPLRILTENCRTALFHALRTMPDSDHRNEVLMPAYNCGVEIEAIINAGFTPSFFPVGPFCRVDPADIRRSINRHTAAVMLTHFNGFPQPAKEVKKMCSEEGITFIEDCAHVLQTTGSEGSVGSFGDFAAFSLKKFLPIPDGGLLAINTPFDHETVLRQLPAKEVALSTVRCALDISRARRILRRNAGVTASWKM